MGSAVFDHVSRELEDQTAFTAVEARGTVRLALKAAGLDAATVSAADMAVVLAKILPGELRSRKVANADDVCAEIRQGLAQVDAGRDTGQTADEVFRRLGG